MHVNYSWKTLCAVFITLWIVAGTSSAAAQVFQGNFPWQGSYNDQGEPYGTSIIDIDFTFNIDSASAVHLDFNLECRSQDNAELSLDTEWDGYIIRTKASKIEQPYGPFPLTKGTYRVRLWCYGEKMEVNESVGYSLNVTTVPASTFAEDEEPDPGKDKAVDINRSQSFEGTIGIAGYFGLKDRGDTTCLSGNWTDNCGMDPSDQYYFNIAKDVTLQFRLDYDKTFIDNPQFDYNGHDGGDLQLRIYYMKDDEYYWVTSFDDWRRSGDLSKQITTLSGGLFRVDIVGAFFLDANGQPQHMPKGKSFGGYKLGVIVNGEPEPEELLVTVREATWQTKQVRDYNGDGIQHYLDVNFDVENKYNETQTIVNAAAVDTPVAEYIKGVTIKTWRAKLLSKYKQGDCPTGRIDWAEFCYKESYDNGWCNYSTHSSEWSISSSIPAHTKRNFTLSIPVTSSQYFNFDESFQIVAVSTKRTSAWEPEACYVHGLSFWPTRTFIPAVNLLLKE